jgi:lactoylglutathione lyase
MAVFFKALMNIYAADIEKAMRFYGGVLGLRETFRFPASGTPEHVEYAVGETTVAVSSPVGLASHGMPAPSAGHPFEIGLKTDDVDTLIAELKRKGVRILKEPFSIAAGNRVAYIADPDGTWISLYHTQKG